LHQPSGWQQNKMKTRIETDRYEFSHGKAPRGQGSWAFHPNFNVDATSPEILWVHQATWGQAKKAAIAHFSAKGIDTVQALS
jgi:hypothetical protein